MSRVCEFCTCFCAGLSGPLDPSSHQEKGLQTVHPAERTRRQGVSLPTNQRNLHLEWIFVWHERSTAKSDSVAESDRVGFTIGTFWLTPDPRDKKAGVFCERGRNNPLITTTAFYFPLEWELQFLLLSHWRPPSVRNRLLFRRAFCDLHSDCCWAERGCKLGRPWVAWPGGGLVWKTGSWSRDGYYVVTWQYHVMWRSAFTLSQCVLVFQRWVLPV